MVDRHNEPIELRADVAGVLRRFRDMVELMKTNGELQQHDWHKGDRSRVSPQA